MRYLVLAALICAILLTAVIDAFSADNAVVPQATPVELRVAVLCDDLPGDDPAFAASIAAALSNQADAKVVKVDELSTGIAASPAAFDFIVFPNAVYLPDSLIDPLSAFLKSGGDMLVIGGPAFSKVVTEADGSWKPVSAPEGSPIGAPSPVLESLSPSYKTYTVSATRLVPNKPYAEWAFTSEMTGQVEVVSPVWRSRGLGTGTKHSARWIPLLYAFDAKGERRGTAAAIRINNDKNFPGSIWGYIGFSGKANREAVTMAVSRMVARISHGGFLMNAGMNKFGYSAGEEAGIAADVMLQGNHTKPSVRLRIASSLGPVTLDRIVDLPSTAARLKEPIIRRSRSWDANYNGRYVATVELLDNGKVIDTISHEFSVIDPYKQSTNTVTTKDGDFYLNGQKWHPLGVNYWPRYVAGLEQEDKWNEWLDPERYDPEIVEQDLKAIKSLGMNVVSIQYTQLSQAPALIDFLERCRQHGLKAHVYVQGLHPLDSVKPLPGIKLITAARLNDNDTVFAYDVGWEVNVGPQERRNQWDKAWQDWILERYGSIENAEKDWNYKLQAKDGVVTGPSDDQLKNDGDWRVMIAAYRRFWDDTISREYARVRREIRKIDKVCLIGARSGYGGTGQMYVVDRLPFDLASGAKHLDYISPEAWGLGADWPGTQAGGFHTLYAKFVSKNKPVFWAEYGKSIWPKSDQEQIDLQTTFYKNFYRMIHESGANGGAGWWWAGGLRVGEKSDYGMINPDGTVRPAAPLAKEALSKLTAQKTAMQTGESITIDRDKHVTGYAGVWAASKEEYLRILSSGNIPGLKTEATGTNSLNMPLVAVGNTPLNGNNPPKYLNAEINSIGVYTLLKRDVETEEGLVYRVAPGKSMKVKVSIGNTGEAEWLALPTEQEGAVILTVTTAEGKVYKMPIPRNIGTLEDVEMDIAGLIPPVKKKTTLTLQMEAVGRGRFGNKTSVTLAP